MTKTKNFIKGLGLSTLLTFAASCSNGDEKNASGAGATLADSILVLAQNQAKDINFMTETDYIFASNKRPIYCDYFYQKGMATKFIDQHKEDSAKYADALVRDANKFKNMDDFNKKFNRENAEHAEDAIYINYCRYRRSLALLNLARQEYKKRIK